MHFTGLRLFGFKSFVEPTELEIAPGLTGVVGPNGCGKSNLVEALRWAMGESSPKRMRGGEMDDVIFAGTHNRPARNLAEVTLTLDNQSRTAPAAFNAVDQLEVTRRIERGMGSDYLVNAKTTRAKDVALLFQDNGTGANSAALVSQGKIGALIAAKPTERRLLLEEAAGITGLHTRRHEAELKLKGAEANLQRVDDVMVTMDAQLQMLKKQARQATRYRNINSEVRRQEAMLLYLRRTALLAQIEDAIAAFRMSDGQVAELMAEVARFETARTEAAAGLPELRQAEAAAAAIVQRLNIAREQLEAEAVRVEGAQQAAEARRSQAERDIGREESLAADALRALQQIETEQQTLAAESEGGSERAAALSERAEETLVARETAEAAVAELTAQISTAEAMAASYARQKAELEGRQARAQERQAEIRAQRAKVEAEKHSDLFLHTAQSEVSAAGEALAAAVAAVQAAESARTESDNAVTIAREKVQLVETSRASLAAEQQGIARLLEAGRSEHPPVLENVEAAPGYEQALAAALGEDLDLPLDGSAPAYWQSLPGYSEMPVWPVGVEPLSARVQAPAALARRLAMIGVAEAGMAATLAAELKPGQCLVTREGAVWRWDGVVIKAGAPTASAARLQQRNRLAELAVELETAEAAVERERHALADILNRSTAAVEAVRTARAGEESARAAQLAAQKAVAETEAQMAAANARLASLSESDERLAGELASLGEELASAEAAQAGVPDVSAAKAQLMDMKSGLAAAQAEAAEAEAARRQFVREAEQRQARLSALTGEAAQWQQRAAGAQQQLDDLRQRVSAAAEELAALAEKPGQIAAQRAQLMSDLSEAESRRQTAADTLATAEATLGEAEKNLKQAEHALSDRREARARFEAEVSNLKQGEASLIERIAEKCECPPDGLAALAEVEDGQPLPEPEAVEARLDKLLREREALGPVNLRAEQEVEEQLGQIQTMQSEKSELTEAIAKLRGAIGSINREARERLLAAFETVNGHFGRLFARLFGGGTASLKLTEADDPLEAGLEVVAQPPGKKLQNLTLLSGGEQALTSMALIFGVFLTHPSPICVLDEVDAPLDEANIDRFCGLLEDMAAEGTTRFLVITHQRLTMSRMHRLYGVTMMEKGVSKLVSVDLEAASAMRDVA